MTPLAWSWLLSLTGAALFFAAGAAFRLRRSTDVPFEQRDALERELTQRTAERQQLFRELEIERSARVTPSEPLLVDTSGVTDSETAGLRHELALIREQLIRRERQLDQLREENVKLHVLEEDLGLALREIAVLNEQARVLRAQAFVSSAPRPRTPTPTLSSTGRALQTIVDTETRLGRAKSAVIADELGLLVAASSASNEYNDALAALGAYLADVGSKTRDILPLRKLRQVIVCDDHDVILTVRPLSTDDPGLALVTLAVDPKPSANDNRQN